MAPDASPCRTGPSFHSSSGVASRASGSTARHLRRLPGIGSGASLFAAYSTVTFCASPLNSTRGAAVLAMPIGPISLNWAGQPLRTWDTLLAYMRGTTTTTGLKVDAFRHDGCYETGRSVAQEDLDALNLERHAVCPNWNYTLRSHPQATVEAAQEREVVS
jgi:hypothetical protein